MSVKTQNEPAPVPAPAPPSSPQEPAGPLPAAFLPSEELAEQLLQFEKVQVEIDRRRAEELARLRAIQDRD
jgi:hypothetical protein